MANLGSIGHDNFLRVRGHADSFDAPHLVPTLSALSSSCGGHITAVAIEKTSAGAVDVFRSGTGRPQAYITTREDGINTPLRVDLMGYGKVCNTLGISTQPIEIRRWNALFGHEFLVTLYGTKRAEVWGPYTLPASNDMTLTGDFPDGQVGVAYSGSLTVTNIVELAQWSLSGNLPPGLSFDLGELTGTPTTAGTYRFYVSVVDPYDGGHRWKEFDVTIAPA